MPDYDPIPDLCARLRELAQLWADWGMDFHPAYARALEAADRAERWRDENRLVAAEVR